MKRYFSLLLILLFAISCSKNSDESLFQELAPTVSVNLPDSLKTGQTYEFDVLFKKASRCHYFSGFDISKNENKILVGVVNSYNSNDNNCPSDGNIQETAKLNFVAEREDFYIFKFWQGKSSVGEDKFLTKEVPIIPPEI